MPNRFSLSIRNFISHALAPTPYVCVTPVNFVRNIEIDIDIKIAVEIYCFEILNNDDDFRTFFLVTCAFSRDLRVEVKTTYLYFATFMASPTTTNIGIDTCLSVLISLIIFEWYSNLYEIMNTGKYLSPKNVKQCLSFLFWEHNEEWSYHVTVWSYIWVNRLDIVVTNLLVLNFWAGT